MNPGGLEFTVDNTDPVLSNFTYYSLAALQTDVSSFNINMAPGSSVEIIGDSDMTTSNSTTIQNIGNIMMDLQIKGGDLTYDENSIDISNMYYAFSGNDFAGALGGTMTSDFQTEFLGLGFGPDMTNELSFRIDIPYNTVPGEYAGDISIVAIAS